MKIAQLLLEADAEVCLTLARAVALARTNDIAKVGIRVVRCPEIADIRISRAANLHAV